ncbi:MAG TPA: hypothetical protein VLF93_07565 [Candidatus Saccharimonadales bacterium]|nr:hypothetical protein [Candidatus Saccharimonadales bacterium]
MNKKILMSGMSIMASLAMLGGSAFAAFATSASATDSTFSTGTDSLLVSHDNVTEDFASTITSPFTGTKITPGYHHVFTFFLKNDATQSTDDLNVSASFVRGAGETGDSGLENVLSTQFSCTDGAVITTPSAFSVTSMLGGSVSLGTIKSGDTASCTLTVDLPLSADNTVSGKSTSFDVSFNANGVPVTPTP